MSDRLWLYLEYAAFAGVVFVLYHVVLHDLVRHRFRMPRRCPKCWYDLAHSSGLTCNECGYTAKRERQLHRARKRWRWVWLALIFFIAADQFPRIPAIRERGTIAAIPTPILALSITWIEPDFTIFSRVRLAPATLPILDWDANFIIEEIMNRRIQGEDLSQVATFALHAACWWNDADMYGGPSCWETTHDMVMSCVSWRNAGMIAHYREAIHPPPLELRIETRDAWPADAEVVIRLRANDGPFTGTTIFDARPTDESPGRAWSKQLTTISARHSVWLADPDVPNQNFISIGRAESNRSGMSFDVRARSYFIVHPSGARRWIDRELASESLRVEFDVASDERDVITPVVDFNFDARLRRLLSPRVKAEYTNRWPWLRLTERDDAVIAFLNERDFVFAAEIEVLDGETIIARGSITQGPGYFFTPENGLKYPNDVTGAIVQTYMKPVADEKLRLEPGRPYRLRLRGSRDLALRDFNATSYWAGEIVMPLSVEFDHPFKLR